MDMSVAAFNFARTFAHTVACTFARTFARAAFTYILALAPTVVFDFRTSPAARHLLPSFVFRAFPVFPALRPRFRAFALCAS